MTTSCASLTPRAFLVALCFLGTCIARRLPDNHCQGGGMLGDKWFDGCQWCVCTSRGNICSHSQCSSLVKKVPPCHVQGQRWTDGCYNCRCKRHGIACSLDLTCHLLRRNPVPCLADERCVCGPDGVPSCTAEVIDRAAFSSKRVDLGLSAAFLGQDMSKNTPALLTSDLPPVSTTQELLITSDNLCRFGPRWYGGSLRCFCDMDGSITCGNPAVVTAFFDEFNVKQERCEEGHAWEETCAVCSCRVNGVVFCRRDQKCRFFGGGPFDDDVDDNNEYDSGIDHYLPGFDSEYQQAEDEMRLPSAPVLTHPPPRAPWSRDNGGKGEIECEPFTRWRDGCRRCRCNDKGRVACHQRHCSDNLSKGGEVPGPDDQLVIGSTKDNKDRSKSDPKSRPQGQEEEGHKYRPDEDSNLANEPPPTIQPFLPQGPRGPMMKVPLPPGGFQLPAYVQAFPDNLVTCGRFKVGEKYWDDCNLCFCTEAGPKCEGKLCR